MRRRQRRMAQFESRPSRLIAEQSCGGEPCELQPRALPSAACQIRRTRNFSACLAIQARCGTHEPNDAWSMNVMDQASDWLLHLLAKPQAAG
ncbi:hypothetical protein WJX74_007639 [Apatococcus lobatus]|uniref:Uncharacterized protein n=1 Tax=Apatococcus lobatus TaxID=904363 RepID=A0AAW1R1B8_9CHLO